MYYDHGWVYCVEWLWTSEEDENWFQVAGLSLNLSLISLLDLARPASAQLVSSSLDFNMESRDYCIWDRTTYHGLTTIVKILILFREKLIYITDSDNRVLCLGTFSDKVSISQLLPFLGRMDHITGLKVLVTERLFSFLKVLSHSHKVYVMRVKQWNTLSTVPSSSPYSPKNFCCGLEHFKPFIVIYSLAGTWRRQWLFH